MASKSKQVRREEEDDKSVTKTISLPKELAAEVEKHLEERRERGDEITLSQYCRGLFRRDLGLIKTA